MCMFFYVRLTLFSIALSICWRRLRRCACFLNCCSNRSVSSLWVFFLKRFTVQQFKWSSILSLHIVDTRMRSSNCAFGQQEAAICVFSSMPGIHQLQFAWCCFFRARLKHMISPWTSIPVSFDTAGGTIFSHDKSHKAIQCFKIFYRNLDNISFCSWK